MGIIIIIMKLLDLVAAAVAMTETELRAMTPNQRAIESSVRVFAKKMAALKAAIKLQKTQDDRIRKAFFKRHAQKVKGWVAQRKAMKAKFISILKNAKAALKKSTVPKQVKTLKAMDKRLAATVKRDLTAFFKEGHALDKMRTAVWKKRTAPHAKAVAAQGKKVLKAMFS